jgi:hypothetical protein
MVRQDAPYGTDMERFDQLKPAAVRNPSLLGSHLRRGHRERRRSGPRRHRGVPHNPGTARPGRHGDVQSLRDPDHRKRSRQQHRLDHQNVIRERKNHGSHLTGRHGCPQPVRRSRRVAQTIPEGCLGAVTQEALSPWPLKFEPLISCGIATQTTRNELSGPPAKRN